MRRLCQSLVLVCALAGVTRAEPLWKPVPASPAARQLVRDRMKDHGREIEALLWAVLFLDYDNVVRAAGAIARNAKPLDRNEPELDKHLQFYALQTELRARALNLAEAARSKDGLTVSNSYNQLSETCVHCHVLYVEPSPIKYRRPLP